MVPMAPSATITRLANWSRNSWARVLVDVVMRSGRKSPSKRGKCDMFHFNAGGEGRALSRPLRLNLCLGITRRICSVLGGMQGCGDLSQGRRLAQPHGDAVGILGLDHAGAEDRSEEHTSELQSLRHLVCR